MIDRSLRTEDTSTGLDYPPSPWRLEGSLQAGVFTIPAHRLPPLGSGDISPVKLLGRALVCMIWAQYGPEGQLTYNEALLAVLVRHPRALAFTIPAIWVDDLQAAIGGRQLWAIPKEIGKFGQMTEQSYSRALHILGEPVATFDGRPALRLPGRWRLPLRLAQSDRGSVVWPEGDVRARISAVKGQWWFSPQGPLAWMGHATQIAAGALEGATVNFGRSG
jgi:Acetoacetate decarboxylase (ADC)